MRLDERKSMALDLCLQHALFKSNKQKTISQKASFLHFMASGGLTINLRWNLKERRYRSVSWVIFCYLRFCVAIILRSRGTDRHQLSFFNDLRDLWWPQYWPKLKNDWSDFEWAHTELSISVSRVLLGCLVFEINGGPIWPLPTMAKVPETATRARVKKSRFNLIIARTLTSVNLIS